MPLKIVTVLILLTGAITMGCGMGTYSQHSPAYSKMTLVFRNGDALLESKERGELMSLITATGISASILDDGEVAYGRANDPTITVKHPIYVSSDFNGDGSLDYASVLRFGEYGPEEERWGNKYHKTRLVLVVFTSATDGYVAWQLKDVDYYIPLVNVTLSVVKKGTVLTEAEEGPSVKIDCDAISLSYLEKSEVVYYWSNKDKKFKEIWTSD